MQEVKGNYLYVLLLSELTARSLLSELIVRHIYVLIFPEKI